MGAYGLPDTQNGASGVPLARRSLPRCASDLARGSVLQLMTCRGRFSPAGTTEDGGVPISLGECIDGEAALSVKSAASPSVSFQRICRPMLSAIVRIIQEPVCKTNGPQGSILPPGPLYGSVCFTFWHPAPVSVCFRAFLPPAGPVHIPAAVRWYQSSCR